MNDAERRIHQTAEHQLGLFSRAQALDAGLSYRQVAHRVKSERFEQLGPNVFAVPGSPQSTQRELLALTIDIGGPVWVAGVTAAQLYGLTETNLQPPFHLAVNRGRAPQRRDNAIVHRLRELRPGDYGQRGALPILSPARTLIHIAEVASEGELASAVETGICSSLVSERQLHRRIVQLRTRGRTGLPALHSVLGAFEVRHGGRSWLERRTLELFATAGLPTPDCEVVLSATKQSLVRVDFRFPGTNVVVEVLGYHFHSRREHLDRDTRRLNALLQDGYRPFQFTYGQIVTEPHSLVATVQEAIGNDSLAS